MSAKLRSALLFHLFPVAPPAALVHLTAHPLEIAHHWIQAPGLKAFDFQAHLKGNFGFTPICQASLTRQCLEPSAEPAYHRFLFGGFISNLWEVGVQYRAHSTAYTPWKAEAEALELTAQARIHPFMPVVALPPPTLSERLRGVGFFWRVHGFAGWEISLGIRSKARPILVGLSDFLKHLDLSFSVSSSSMQHLASIRSIGGKHRSPIPLTMQVYRKDKSSPPKPLEATDTPASAPLFYSGSEVASGRPREGELGHRITQAGRSLPTRENTRSTQAGQKPGNVRRDPRQPSDSNRAAHLEGREKRSNEGIALLWAEGQSIHSVLKPLSSTRLQPLNQKDGEDRTHLHRAAGQGHKELVERFLTVLSGKLSPPQLLELLNKEGPNGGTTLHQAASQGHKKVVAAFLTGLAPELGTHQLLEVLNKQNLEGETALHRATYRGREKVIETFLTVLARQLYSFQLLEFLNKRDAEGRTALHRAATRRCEKVVKTFLTVLAPQLELDQFLKFLSKRDWEGGTALHRAASQGREKTVKAFLTLFPSQLQPCQLFEFLNTQDRGGATALHRAASQGRAETVKTFLTLFPSRLQPCQLFEFLNTQDLEGETALHQAATEGHEKVVETFLTVLPPQLTLPQLLEFLNKQTAGGETALRQAVSQGHEKVVEAFLSFLADKLTPDQLLETLKAEDRRGSTLLHLAASSGSKGVVQALLSERLITGQLFELLNKEDAHGTVLHRAASRGDEKVVEAFLTILSPQLEVPQLLEYLSRQDARGETALHRAASRGHEKAVEAFLSSLADKLTPDQLFELLRKKDAHGSTALHQAASAWSSERLKGRDQVIAWPDNKASRREAALSQARSSGHKEAVRLMLAKLEDRHLLKSLEVHKDTGGNLLHVACLEEQTELLKLLLDRLLIPVTWVELDQYQHSELLNFYKKYAATRTEGEGEADQIPQLFFQKPLVFYIARMIKKSIIHDCLSQRDRKNRTVLDIAKSARNKEIRYMIFEFISKPVGDLIPKQAGKSASPD